MGYIEIEYIRYKGKGEHSVSELEKIIEQREYELRLIRSGDIVKKDVVLGDVIKCECGRDNKNVPKDGYDYVCKCGKII